MSPYWAAFQLLVQAVAAQTDMLLCDFLMLQQPSRQCLLCRAATPICELQAEHQLAVHGTSTAADLACATLCHRFNRVASASHDVDCLDSCELGKTVCLRHRTCMPTDCCSADLKLPRAPQDEAFATHIKYNVRVQGFQAERH